MTSEGKRWPGSEPADYADLVGMNVLSHDCTATQLSDCNLNSYIYIYTVYICMHEKVLHLFQLMLLP